MNPSKQAVTHEPVRRREIFGYCMYDFANSSYTTLISTVAFAVYFKEAVVGPDGPGDFLWSVAQAVAMGILILSSPVVGAVADHSGRKKLFLFATTVQTVVACAALYFIEPGYVWLGIALYIVGTIGFEGGYIFYNAFLPEISTPRTIGKISGWSWGLGFIGGLCCLVACFPFLKKELSTDGVLSPEGVAAWRLSFIVVAVFFALFSIPTFAFLRDRGQRRPVRSPVDFVSIGFRRLRQTLAHVRAYRDIALFVLAAFFFYGSIQTVIKFSGLYARESFGMPTAELVLLLIASNVAAAIGTPIAGHLADRVGRRAALAGTLVFWFLLLVFGALITSKALFWALASGIAIGMGSTQAIARSYMAEISPRERESEFFGFYVLASQLGAVVTLLVFGTVSSFLGGQRFAVLVTAPSFLIALLLISMVGRRRTDAEA